MRRTRSSLLLVTDLPDAAEGRRYGGIVPPRIHAAILATFTDAPVVSLREAFDRYPPPHGG